MRLFNIPLVRIVPDDTKFDFMRFRRISFPISALLSIVAIVLFFHPGLNLGIDFRGGTLMEIQTKAPADIAQVDPSRAVARVDARGRQPGTGSEGMGHFPATYPPRPTGSGQAAS